MESMREDKENYRISTSIINTTSSFGGNIAKLGITAGLALNVHLNMVNHQLEVLLGAL